MIKKGNIKIKRLVWHTEMSLYYIVRQIIQKEFMNRVVTNGYNLISEILRFAYQKVRILLYDKKREKNTKGFNV